MKNDQKDKIEIRDIYETFWKCRDFELANLWQRSIFLTAFLVLIFTAYGTLLSKILEIIDKCTVSTTYLNLVCYLLSILGIVFSIMWIKMGKGSKAWYEAYESAIRAIERSDEFATEDARKYGGFSYQHLPNYKGIDIDNRLFNGKAGEYSPSRINIGIGQVFLIVWLLIGVVHAVFFAISIAQCRIAILIALGLILLLCLCYWWVGKKERFESGFIQYFSPEAESK